MPQYITIGTRTMINDIEDFDFDLQSQILSSVFSLYQFTDQLFLLYGQDAEFPGMLRMLSMNATGSLVSALNYLDGSKHDYWFSHTKGWNQYLVSIHRTFFNSLQLAIEGGLKDWCMNHGGQSIPDNPSRKKEWEEFLAKEALTPAQIDAVIKKLKIRPEFKDDYLKFALASLSKDRRKYWTAIFDALGTIRNKASHHDTRLDTNEKEKLEKAGFQDMIKPPDDELAANPLMYRKACDLMHEFYKELRAADTASQSSS